MHSQHLAASLAQINTIRCQGRRRHFHEPLTPSASLHPEAMHPSISDSKAHPKAAFRTGLQGGGMNADAWGRA